MIIGGILVLDMQKYEIAEVIFQTSAPKGKLLDFLKAYEYHGEENAELTINVTDKEAEREIEIAKVKVDLDYAIGLAILRKLVEYIVSKKDGILLHASAVAVDDEAFLFLAKSGTGKSTHTRIYKKLFGDRVTIVNDDKPILRLVNGEFFVYGTPWSGKANLNSNVKVKVKGLCKLERGKDNEIFVLDNKSAVNTLLNQTVRFTSGELTLKSLEIIEKLVNEVSFYLLKCNQELTAGEISYKAMKEGIK